MPIDVQDEGQNNTILVPSALLQFANGKIQIKGDGNRVEIGPGCKATSVNIVLGHGCRFVAGAQARLGQLTVYMARDAVVEIGEKAGFTAQTLLAAHEPGLISIGQGCLIAGNTRLSVSDMHTIFDVATGERVNPAANVVLEERVWLAEGVRVMKGVRIGAGSIVAAGAIVTRDVPRESLVAGVPATIRRRGVTWRHDLT